MTIEVKVANYSDKTHSEEITFLLNAYASDEMGGGKPLDKNVINNVVPELSKLPHAFSIIGYVDNQAAGLVNCFEGFSTFSCKPLINIHDMMVLEKYRKKGVSHIMLQKVEEIAIEKGCCKLTLEVLNGNETAKLSYRKYGFTGYELSPEAGVAEFWQKSV